MPAVPQSGEQQVSEARRIAFIGGGNMARSLIGGIVAAGGGKTAVTVADPDAGQREAFAGMTGVETTADNAAAVAGAGLVVLAVKPQIAPRALESVAPVLARERPLLISIAAGLRIERIEDAAGAELPVVRAMPNTPALVKRGVSAFFANDRVERAGRRVAREVLEAVGTVIEVDEEAQLDAVTAVSGSGPAYFFLLVEALADAAAAAGLPAETAARLAAGTGIGAMALLDESGEPPARLRERVTSPGGTTAAALDVFAEGDLRGLVRRAVLRARERAEELS